MIRLENQLETKTNPSHGCLAELLDFQENIVSVEQPSCDQFYAVGHARSDAKKWCA